MHIYRGSNLRDRSRFRVVGAALAVAGGLIGSVGLVIALAALNPVSASALQSCGTPAAVVPGQSGTCSGTISDTNAVSYTGQVNVTLAIYTTSSSGGRPTGTGFGTEALMDGQPDGLQVTVVDTTTNQKLALGSIACYANRSQTSRASYPNASYCVSSSSFQTVATNVDIASFSNNFVIHWWFPQGAGDSYECGRAKVMVQSDFTGTGGSGSGGSGTLGASTGPTGPNGGVLAASTGAPTTGAALPEVLGTLLLATGIFLVLTGALLYRRRPRFGDGRPPTLAPAVGL